jgi:hypothetical protein
MLYVHPVLMLCLILLALYVFTLGYARFASKHLGRKTMFQWKRHVLLGRFAMVGLAAGMCGGVFMTWFFWGAPFAARTHVGVALAMLALIVSGVATGQSLNKTRKPDNPLALVHGIGNTLLAILALVQIYTGYHVLKDFIW